MRTKELLVMVRVLLCLSVLLVCKPAMSEPNIIFGAKAGISITPDQLVVGGMVLVSNISDQGIGLSAGGLLGLGDHLTTLRFYGHAYFEFPIKGQNFSLYPLGGISFLNYRADCPEELDCSVSEVGLDLGGGISYKNLRGELWLGVGDIPDAILSGAYLF